MFSCERVGFVSRMDIGPGYDLTLGHDFNKLAAGMENHYQASNEEIESTLSSFLTGQLCLKQPSDMLYPKVKHRENAGLYQLAGKDDQPYELLFYRASEARSDRSDDYVLNGYFSCISEDLSGQSYIVLTQNGVFTKNEGSFYVTDHGVIAGSVKIYYDFEECLTDRDNEIRYTSDEESSNPDELRMLNESARAKTGNPKLTYKEYMKFESDSREPEDPSKSSDPGAAHAGWGWWFAREEGGEWTLVGQGY